LYGMILGLAVVLVAPIIIVFRSWSLLAWHGRWFL
jgi:hypothetical protein